MATLHNMFASQTSVRSPPPQLLAAFYSFSSSAVAVIRWKPTAHRTICSTAFFLSFSLSRCAFTEVGYSVKPSLHSLDVVLFLKCFRTNVVCVRWRSLHCFFFCSSPSLPLFLFFVSFLVSAAFSVAKLHKVLACYVFV